MNPVLCGPAHSRRFRLGVVALVSVSLGISALCLRTAAHQAQGPVFKSGVELIAIDVSVVDKTGLFVRDLRAEQFDVMVDGRPRRVTSAELVDHAASQPAAATSKASAPLRPAYSSNDAPGRPALPGRLIFIVVDQGTFRPAATRGAVEAARRFVDRLQAADRVGLVAFPPPGPNIAASRNHEAVRAALPKIVGTADLLRPTGLKQISVSEALDIAAGDSFMVANVSARECVGESANGLKMCQDDLVMSAQSMAVEAERRARQSLDGIAAIVDGLAAIPERKTLVLVSAGFPASDRPGGRVDVTGAITAIGRRAERANTNIYVLHVDTAFLDTFSAEAGRVSETFGRDNAMLAAGIENLASASGGTLFRAVSGADTAFDRILRETAASYVLGVEPADADRDGKPHAIRVNVKVPGAQVRSRREFLLAAGAAAAAPPSDPLAAALGSRRVATEVPMGVSTHALAPQPGGRLRVAVTANIGRNLRGAAEFKIALVVTDGAGSVVLASKPATERLRVPPDSDTGSGAYLTTMALAPGEYNLRLAAVDAAGRAGSVDHAFSARLGAGEGITMSDLMLFHAGEGDQDLAGIADGRVRSGLVQLHLEVFGRGGGALPGVTFGVSDASDGPFLIQARGSVKKDAQGRAVAEAVLDLGLLPPGDYVASAVVSDGKRRLGVRQEALRVEAALPASAPADPNPGAPGRLAAPRVRFFLGDSTALVRGFERADVLGPTTLRYFADRLAAADPTRSASADQALTHFRNARFDEILVSLRDTPSETLSVAFLKGIALLAKNELEPAAKELRESIRIADDFLPAAFYLGACYAEGGRADEAVGAWQTALVTEGDARIVYDVLVDALLRLEDAGQAAQVLREAQQRWPEDEAFMPRQAVAEVMQGRRAEALATLARYLDTHRADTEAAALAIRLIYEARAAGQTIASIEADREAAARYGEWYRGAGGANRALVDRWLEFIAKK